MRRNIERHKKYRISIMQIMKKFKILYIFVQRLMIPFYYLPYSLFRILKLVKLLNTEAIELLREFMLITFAIKTFFLPRPWTNMCRIHVCD